MRHGALKGRDLDPATALIDKLCVSASTRLNSHAVSSDQGSYLNPAIALIIKLPVTMSC